MSGLSSLRVVPSLCRWYWVVSGNRPSKLQTNKRSVTLYRGFCFSSSLQVSALVSVRRLWLGLCKPNKPFLPRVAFGHGCSLTALESQQESLFVIFAGESGHIPLFSPDIYHSWLLFSVSSRKLSISVHSPIPLGVSESMKVSFPKQCPELLLSASVPVTSPLLPRSLPWNCHYSGTSSNYLELFLLRKLKG